MAKTCRFLAVFSVLRNSHEETEHAAEQAFFSSHLYAGLINFFFHLRPSTKNSRMHLVCAASGGVEMQKTYVFCSFWVECAKNLGFCTFNSKTTKNNVFCIFTPPDAALTKCMREFFVLGLRRFRVKKQNGQIRLLARWKDSLLDCMLRFLVTVPRNRENSQDTCMFLPFSSEAILQKNPAQKHQKNRAV